MCGIAGLIAEKEQVVRAALPAMVAAQEHRGPDDCGDEYRRFGQRYVGLGHRRLSILDLTCAGHQPMVDPASGNLIVFNGEIYNFRRLRNEMEADGETFSGTGDTEVLLRGLTRFGPTFIPRLEGMYAFAFFDVSRETVLLARDPCGIKPLYVAVAPQGLLFASEVRAILASGLVSREVDLQGVTSMLAYGAVQQPSTIFRAIRSFPPGFYQEIPAHGSGAGHEPVRFWSFPEVRSDITVTDAVTMVERTLRQAVDDHLISDVPVGVFLSSGLDSTVIAAMAGQNTSRLRSFTVGFADQPDLSEMTLASETARLFNLEHTEIDIRARDAEAEALHWLKKLDQPSIDGLNVFIIARAVRAQGICVALSGQGGDELFGGYPAFGDVPRLQAWMRRMRFLPRPVLRTAGRLATFHRSEAVREKMRDILGTDGSIRELYLQRRRVMSNSQLQALGLNSRDLGLTDSYLSQEAFDFEALPGGDPIAAISRLEMRHYQGNMLLRDSDTNGMAHGLEIRVPLLDQRLINLVSQLPDHVRLPGGLPNKRLLRVACAQHLRPALLSQGKRGFTLPIRRWMLGPLRDLCEHAIISLKSAQILREQGVDQVWEAFLRDPESPIWSRAFSFCVLGIYLKNTGVT
jgi:asparagine synthase (glutamine-hydrolysing)